MISGKKILITGATGQVAGPIALELAKTNEVWCLGRFGDPKTKALLESHGIKTHRWNMGFEKIAGLADDFTHVLHSAFLRDTADYEAAMELNTVGTGTLMTHCRKAEAFLYISAFALYKFVATDHEYAETDTPGCTSDWMPAYAPSKIATEGVVRAMARTLDLPTTIARLNTAYGPMGHGGVPIRFFKQMQAGEPIIVPCNGVREWHSPIHTDDLARQTPLLWAHAAVKPPIVNWAGDEKIAIIDMMDLVSELTGVPVRYEESAITRTPFASNNDRRRAMIGDCQVKFRDGIVRTLEAHFPGSVVKK